MVTFAQLVDSRFSGQRPSAIAAQTAIGLIGIQLLIRLLDDGDLWARFHAFKWRIIRTLFAPIVRQKVKEASKSIRFPVIRNEVNTTVIPEKAIPQDQVIELAKNLHEAMDVDYRLGQLSGAVYHGGDKHTAMVNRVMEIFQWTNPLHVDVFGAARKMEAEVVAMVLALYHGEAVPGDDGACGALTSGGTESIGLAMKSYREWGKARGIQHPSVVAPITAHPAFDKACDYYGLRLIKVPVGPSCAVDPSEMRKYVRSDTVAIVGSAPTFPHGTFDPISALSDLAREFDIGLHVDCCLGSFIVPYLAKAGFEQPIVDFRLPGVTSISCDTHKYGFAPKGTSVVLYRSKQLREKQFFSYSCWPGGIYASPGASGSKAGNVIAATWAAMVSIGDDGYTDACRKIVEARCKMTDAIRALPFLHVYGNPQASVFGFGSNVIDIYILSDLMKGRGWGLNPLQFPPGVQFSVTLLQGQPGVAERFIRDICEIGGELYAAVLRDEAEGKRRPIGAQGGTVYGSQQRVSDRSILDAVMHSYLNGYYATNHSVTQQAAAS